MEEFMGEKLGQRFQFETVTVQYLEGPKSSASVFLLFLTY